MQPVETAVNTTLLFSWQYLAVPDSLFVGLFSYLSTHTVYLYKIHFFHYFGGVWPYWKMDTGKHKFHEILLLCKTEQKDWKSSRHTPLPNAHWLAQCNRLWNLIGSETLSCACVFCTSLLFPSTATRASWNSKCRCHQQNKNKNPGLHKGNTGSQILD